MATVAGSLRNKVVVLDDITTGDLTVTGSLTLSGTATQINSTNTTISDHLIELGSGLSGANTNDLGLILERGSTGNNVFIGWDESADKVVVATTTATGSSTGDLSLSYANFQAAGATFTGNMSATTGNTTGKFAVMSTGVHNSFDFYNNGTSYFNGQTEVNAEFRISSSASFITHFNYQDAGNNIISQANGGSTTIRNNNGNLFVLNSSGNLEITGSITSGGDIYAADSDSTTDPTFAFVGHTDSGLSMSVSGGNDQLSMITDGVRRGYFNNAGITSASNVYTSGAGSFRNYAASWIASTGLTGNGFSFVNSVDGTPMTISSTGTVTAAADMRAPIFYDSSNTDFYIDPVGNSKLYGILYLGHTNTQPGNLTIYDTGNNALEIKGTGANAFQFDMIGTSSTGTLTINDFNLFTNKGFTGASGDLLRRNVSNWTVPIQTSIGDFYGTNLGDYVYLKAAGNSTAQHGILLVGDNSLYYGRTSIETGSVTNDTEAPLDESVAFRITHDGDARFSTRVGIGSFPATNANSNNNDTTESNRTAPLHIRTTGANSGTIVAQTIEQFSGDVVADPVKLALEFKTQDTNNALNIARIAQATVNDTDYGHNSEATSHIIFGTTESGTYVERVIFNGRGHIGLGDTTAFNPTAQINTNSGYFSPDVNGRILNFSGGSHGAFINLMSNTTTDNDQIGGIYFTRTAGAADAHKQLGGIDVIQDAYSGTNTLDGGHMRFFTKQSGSAPNTPRMKIQANGLVGIGTGNGNISYQLQVNSGSTNTTAAFISSDNKASILIQDNDTNTFVSAENGLSSIGANNGVNANNLNVTSAGRVGIGTTSPSAIVEIKDAAAAAPGTALKVHSVQNSAAADGLVFIHSEQSLAPFTALNVRQDGNGDILNLLDGTTEVFTVENGGNVGINNTDPAYKLDIFESGTNTAAIQIKESAASSSWLRMVPNLGSGGFNEISSAGDIGLIFSTDNSSGSDASNGLVLAPWSSTSGNQGIKIHENGNVGIGAKTPAARLHISGNSDISDENCMLIIEDIDGSAGSRIPAIMFRSFTSGTVTNHARIRGTGTQGMVISADSDLANDFVIQRTAGNNSIVGIGTNSPGHQLDALSAGNDSVIRARTPNANAGAYFHASSGSDGFYGLSLFHRTTEKFFIGGYGASAIGFFSGSKSTASNEKMRMLSDGKFGIGTTTPQRRLVVTEPSAASASDNSGILSLTVGTGANTDAKLAFGIESGHRGWIHVVKPGSNVYPLLLNPTGSSNGKVGIGFNGSNPGAMLDVEGGALGGTSGNSVTAAIIRAGRQNLVFKDTRTANGTDWNNATFKMIAQIDSTDHQSIDFVNDSSYNEHIDILTGNQVFNTRFTHNGRVGIGTNNPGCTLHSTGEIRGTLLTDHQNTAFYVDPASNSLLNTAKINYLGLNANANTSGSYRLNMGGHIDMNNNSVHYANEVHFNGGVRFKTSSDSVLSLYGSSTSAIQLNLGTGAAERNGAVYANSSNQVGFLDSDNHWAIRHNANSATYFAINNVAKVRINDLGIRFDDVQDNGQNNSLQRMSNLAGANLLSASTDIARRYSNGANREFRTFVDGTKVACHYSQGTGNTGSCYQWINTEFVDIDPEKTYQYTIWIQSEGDHNIYMGWHERNSSGSQITSNPYFHTATMDTNNGWVKITGILHGHRTPANQTDTEGTDRRPTDNMWMDGGSGAQTTDGVMHSTTTQIMMRFGTCYGNTNTSKTYFYAPTIKEINYENHQHGVTIPNIQNNTISQGSFHFGKTTWSNYSGIECRDGSGSQEFRMHSDSGSLIVRSDGAFYAHDNMRAPHYYDLDNTTYYTNPASTSIMNTIQLAGSLLMTAEGSTNIKSRFIMGKASGNTNNGSLYLNYGVSDRVYIGSGGGGAGLTVGGTVSVEGNQITMASSNARVKYSVWTGTTYGIGMQNSITGGGISNNYAMTFQMNNDNGRGFWFGDSSHTTAQHAMTINTQGRVNIASGLRVGFGESDTTQANASGIHVNGLLDVDDGIIALSGNSNAIQQTGTTLLIGDCNENDDTTTLTLKNTGATVLTFSDSDATFGGNLFVPEYIYHSGDTNTRMRFLGDRVIITAGSVEMIDCVEGGTDYVDIIDRVRVTSGGDMICEGDVVAFTSTTVSDLSQKENIEVIADPLEKVLKLKGVTFDWKKDKTKSAGIIAQDVEKVLPEIVKQKEDRSGEEFKSVDYNGVIGLLVEAVKELKDEINDLKDQLNKK